MSDNLRPAWVIANNGRRLVNIEMGTYLERSASTPNQTTAHSAHGQSMIGTIDQPLDKIVQELKKKNLVLDL
jgi:hypothetical protein